MSRLHELAAMSAIAFGIAAIASAHASADGSPECNDAALAGTDCGYGSLAGDGGTAVGNSATATGANSTAIGRAALASGVDSPALGQGATATGANSTAIGQGASTGAFTIRWLLAPTPSQRPIIRYS